MLLYTAIWYINIPTQREVTLVAWHTMLLMCAEVPISVNNEVPSLTHVCIQYVFCSILGHSILQV